MIIRNTNHKPQYDCGVAIQGGDRGLVGTREGTYITAFVEPFPKNPNTFIRGEDKTVAEAETKSWEKYQRIINCSKLAFERRGYKNGA
ncbi:hypothetical protein ACQKMD_07700 [Viridibacillus sp. NPDC096237]|uniref:hypothetical protein n=1 Tax=Viridibacillus sp. NPDC096237 TaxID=3390721 RepID=UPI003CFE441D